MRILVADDRAEVRSALRLLLEHELALPVLGEVAHGDGLLETLQAMGADLLLLDWELPGPPAGDLVRALRARMPQLSIVALGGRAEVRGAALATGVTAFVSKGEPPALLLALLHQIGERQSEGALRGLVRPCRPDDSSAG